MSSRNISKSSVPRISAISNSDRCSWTLLASAALAVGGPARAQSLVDSVTPAIRSVDGVVQLGLRTGPRPVAGAWVVVHRIASDATGKVSGGPLDSGRTTASGAYNIRYRYSGASDATYIAITTHSGVSYITAPLTRARVSGDDATIMVFDTTAPPYPVRVAGRHFVITAPDSGDRRRVIEVYELSNDSTLTVMGTEANPVWRAPIPPGVSDLELNPIGDITPGTAKQDGDWLKVFAPISPGLRQLSFTYTLPADAFPLSLPIVDSVTVFELLVQELAGVVEGGGFVEVAGVVQEGLTFRRLLAQNVPLRSVITFTMPKPVSRFERKSVAVVASILAVAMGLALSVVMWRRIPSAVGIVPPAPMDPVDALVRELAEMDAAFESRASPTDAERAEFGVKRTALKARLTTALAARDTRT